MSEIDKYKWLFDEMDGMREKIRFKDRVEYRVSGNLHNTLGPAVVFFGESSDTEPEDVQYYLKGQRYTENDWNIAVRPIKLKRLKRKMDKKKNDE
jgi:hypothetical protein